MVDGKKCGSELRLPQSDNERQRGEEGKLMPRRIAKESFGPLRQMAGLRDEISVGFASANASTQESADLPSSADQAK